MSFTSRIDYAASVYEKYGVNVENAINSLKQIPISIHCWQGDDVGGFDSRESLSGGIQATGNYPGKATTPEQLMQDLEKAFSLIPGEKKLNLHASYAIFEENEFVDRNEIQPKHFEKWVEFANEYFITTGSGKFFRNVILDPEHSIGIVKINDKGDSWKVVWGLENGARPTSEFPTHFMNHSVKKSATNNEYRVIYHAHPANLIAMTYTTPLTDKAFTKALWQSATECPVVFPQGVGVVEWMVPGGTEIAMATSKLMKKYDAAVWAHHGLFCSGVDFDITFGLMHTIEKAAEIYNLAFSSGKIIQTITDANLRAIAKEFGVCLNEDFLD